MGALSPCRVCGRVLPLDGRGLCLSSCVRRARRGLDGPGHVCRRCNARGGSCDCILCFCEAPVVDALGECQACHRKPLPLLLASAARLHGAVLATDA